ncbi:hypothetical protein [Actinomadura madurae]|uniref:hypothetical protein n=1 Tax=Actinomadura madurae TaxID=1993 RepID=UPI0020D25E58|nr:hypothetical protein [Actinomadura madurae]MCP9952464.1 hypothetical protein [Actinomadura madurae]MCQ0017902.1 hypothetical protein [Actinomadura madurae]
MLTRMASTTKHSRPGQEPWHAVKSRTRRLLDGQSLLTGGLSVAAGVALVTRPPGSTTWTRTRPRLSSRIVPSSVPSRTAPLTRRASTWVSRRRSASTALRTA